jgi:hypothetical protein
MDSARNGLFLFHRAYLEYHADRYADCSFIVFKDATPAALFPASISGDVITSHGGLTFGGLIVARQMRGGEAIQSIDLLLEAMRQAGGRSLVVKPVPAAFCSHPAADADYALWRRGLSLVRRDLSSMIYLDDPIPFNSLRRRSIRKALNAGLEVRDAKIDEIYPVMAEALAQHDTTPVHSIDELNYLRGLFPSNILVRCAVLGGEVHAGTIVYDYGTVWHTQYLASSIAGRQLGALDLVIDRVISEARRNGVARLSFGISTEHQGRYLNEGLLFQKEGFGARPIVHDFLAGDLELN